LQDLRIHEQDVLLDAQWGIHYFVAIYNGNSKRWFDQPWVPTEDPRDPKPVQQAEWVSLDKALQACVRSPVMGSLLNGFFCP
jgi:hypothetical protein